jgi:integrase
MPKTRSHGDGALYEIRGGKLWRGVVDGGLDATGARQQWYVTAKTKAECARRLNRLRAEVTEHGSPLAKSVKVEQWAPHWLETVAKPDIDPKTYAGYASLVRKWIVPTLGHRKVSALKPSDVRALRVKMTDAGRATSTVRQAHIVLSMILDAAVAEKIVRTNVAHDVRKPGARGAVVVKDRGSLTTAQAVAILKAAAEMPDSAGSRWWFKLLVGQRQGEILGATLADLDLDAGLYTVSWKLEELRRQHGCGDDPCGFKQGARCPQARWIIPDDFEMIRLTGAWHLTRPKSRTGRVIPLVPQLVEAIRRHLAATAHLPNPHGLIWHDGTGAPILPKDDAQEWRDLLHTAGVITKAEAIPGGTSMTGHWARHTTVTILASLKVDFQVIGEIVGHSSAQVTQMYRHAQEAEKRAAVTALGGAWVDAIGPAPKKKGEEEDVRS